MFEQGDRVICISNIGYRNVIAVGSIHTVENCWSEEYEDDDGEMQERWHVSLLGIDDWTFEEDMFELCPVKKIERNLPAWF